MSVTSPKPSKAAAPTPTPAPTVVATVAPTTTGEGKEELEPKRLYIRWRVTDEGLKAAFAKFGTVTEARVVRGPRIHQYGFITFETQEGANVACKAMDGQRLTSEPLLIEHASAAPRRPRGRRAGATNRTRRPRDPKTADAAPAPAAASAPAASPKPAPSPKK